MPKVQKKADITGQKSPFDQVREVEERERQRVEEARKTYEQRALDDIRVIEEKRQKMQAVASRFESEISPRKL